MRSYFLHALPRTILHVTHALMQEKQNESAMPNVLETGQAVRVHVKTANQPHCIRVPGREREAEMRKEQEIAHHQRRIKIPVC